MTHAAVRRVPNDGWDERIIMFQYERLVASFAVVSRRYVVLIDTLINPQTAHALLEFVRVPLQAGRQLLVINTHADWDHCWGNAALVDATHAPIIAHRLCRERLLAKNAATTLAEKQQTEPALYADVRIEPPTLTFDGAFMIDGGDLLLQLIPTSGHTPDHIAIYIPEIRTLFPGDAAEWPIPFVERAATIPQMRESLTRMRGLDPAIVLYCHAPGRYHADVIDANIAYFDELERLATTAIAANKLPNHIDESSDLETQIAFPFESLPGISDLDADELDFYHGAHTANLRAMALYLLQQHP